MLGLTFLTSLRGFTLQPRNSCLGITEKEVLKSWLFLKLTQTTEESHANSFFQLKLTEECLVVFVLFFWLVGVFFSNWGHLETALNLISKKYKRRGRCVNPPGKLKEKEQVKSFSVLKGWGGTPLTNWKKSCYISASFAQGNNPGEIRWDGTTTASSYKAQAATEVQAARSPEEASDFQPNSLLASWSPRGPVFHSPHPTQILKK